MKRILVLVLALVVFAVGNWGTAQEEMPRAPSTGESMNPQEAATKYSYAIGLNLGRTFRTDEIVLDSTNLLAGIKDGLQGDAPKFDEQALSSAMQELGKLQTAAHVRRNQEFLEKNRQDPQVKVLPSGLQYKVLKQGNGPKPELSDTVRTHYTGRFIDGSVFDSSVEGGQPFVTPLTRVIPGWTEALSNMQVGSKWLLVVPSKLGYGASGMGPIPPNSTLVFEMELLGIE